MSAGSTSTVVSTTQRPGYLRAAFAILVSLLALWFLWRVLSDVGLQALSSRIRGANLALIAAALALTVARYLTLAVRWEILARREAPVGLRQITPVLMAGTFLALVTPALRIAGPILRAYYLSKETGRSRAAVYGTIVADQAANFSIFAVVAAVTGVLVSTPGTGRITLAGGVAMLAALTGGLSAGYLMLKQVHTGRPSRAGLLARAVLGSGSAGDWRRRLLAWWEDLARALARAVVGSGSWWPALFLSGVAYAMVTSAQVLAFGAVGARVDFVTAAFCIAAAGAVQLLLTAPNGPGVTEASLIGAFMALGLDGESAAAGVLLARLINYGVLLPWGGYSFLTLQRRYGMPQRGARRVSA